MAGKNTAVYGIFGDQSDVIYDIDNIIEASFRERGYLGVAAEQTLGIEFGSRKAHQGARRRRCWRGGRGGVIGGLLGFFVGLGTLAIPGLAPVLAAGPILATLAGVGAAGAARRSDELFWWVLGMPDTEAKPILRAA